MNPLLLVFAVGFVLGLVPGIAYKVHSDAAREQDYLRQKIEQEKLNAAIVAQYQATLNAVDTWYKSNPVRVRIQGNKGGAECADVTPEDVILTVGGVKGDNGSAVSP